jgi:mannosyltransferase OCH1-like enzyme
MILMGKPKNSEKNLSQCHFVHHKSHWTDLDTNLDHHGEKPVTICLSYGMAINYLLQEVNIFKKLC